MFAKVGYESWQSFENGLYAPTTEDWILLTETVLAERVGGRQSDG